VLAWEEFEESTPDTARFGAQRMSERVLYIGTVSNSGYQGSIPSCPS
jgi:hypothetical protein